MMNAQPTRAVAKLIELVESLRLEREFFSVLQKIGIEWKTLLPSPLPPVLNSHIKTNVAPSSPIVKNNRFELINLYLDCCPHDFYHQLEQSVELKGYKEMFTSRSLHDLLLSNIRSPVIQVIAIDPENGFLNKVDQDTWLSVQMTLLKANNPIMIVLGWKNSVVQAEELKMEMILKNKSVAVVSISNKDVSMESLGKLLVEFYRKLKVIELDSAFERGKQASGLGWEIQLSFSSPEAYEQLSPAE